VARRRDAARGASWMVEVLKGNGETWGAPVEYKSRAAAVAAALQLCDAVKSYRVRTLRDAKK